MKRIVAVIYEDETKPRKVSDDDMLTYARALLDHRAIEAIAGAHVDASTRAMLADTIRGVRDFEREALRDRQSEKASKPRKPATADLDPAMVKAFKAKYEANEGKSKGWQKAAALEFGVSVDTIRDKMKA